MTKTYVPGETKEQRRSRKEQESTSRSLTKEKAILTPLPTTPHTSQASGTLPQKQNKNEDGEKRFVVCLKHGNKYGPEYVNTLHRMVKRNLTLEHEFVCFTEDRRGIDPEVRIMPLPQLPVTGWWYKPMFFNPKLGLNGTILYLDLDLIIFRNIDNLFEYEPGKFCIIRDFNRIHVRNYQKMNSSIFRLQTGQHRHVYDNFVEDPKHSSRRYHGDQDWIHAQIRHKDGWAFWPEEWIQSYKWEMRGKPRMTRDSRGKRNFERPGQPRVLPSTSVAVFHGDPNTHNCVDPWCKEHWR